MYKIIMSLVCVFLLCNATLAAAQIDFQNGYVNRKDVLNYLISDYKEMEAHDSIQCLGISPEKYKRVYTNSVKSCVRELPSRMNISDYNELEDWLDDCIVQYFRRDFGVNKKLFDHCLSQYEAANP